MNEQDLNIVYVLTNSAMPGLVKIGKTTQSDPETRVAQLYTTGVPVPFTIEFACKVAEFESVEKALHTAFEPSRVNPRREFFEIEPEQAIAILKLLSVQDVTSDLVADTIGIDVRETEAAERLRSRRPNANFEEMGIPIGSTLRSLSSDHVAQVIGPKKVLFEGEEMSLSAATRLVKGVDYPLAPGPYWSFNGKVLREIYEETYTSD